MAILAECPACHNKQSVKNRKCKCGEDLTKAKRSQRVRYWIQYRLPGGKQRKEFVGYSIEEARDAEGKRRSQKREGRIFEMLPESRITFKELAGWYLKLAAVRSLSSHRRVAQCVGNFLEEFGNMKVNSLKPELLEGYQLRRREDGVSPRTIDYEIGVAQAMVTKAFWNDKVGAGPLRAFKRIKKMLRKGENARQRIITIAEYVALYHAARQNLRPFLALAYCTGMRLGELRGLRWSFINRDAKTIRLPAELTKEAKFKSIPITSYIQGILDGIPRHLRHDFVLTTSRGEPIKNKNGLIKSLKSACEKARIPYGQKEENGITFHDFRRSAKTHMLTAGVSKTHRDLILGHALQGMDVHYIHPDDKSLLQAMERYHTWLTQETDRLDPKVTQSVF